MDKNVRVILLSDMKDPELEDIPGLQIDIDLVNPDMSHRSELICRIFEESDDFDLVGLLDVSGGNDLEDMRSLLKMSIREGDQFACAHIRPRNEGMGCWLIDGDLLQGSSSEECICIENTMMDLAKAEDLRLFRVQDRSP